MGVCTSKDIDDFVDEQLKQENASAIPQDSDKLLMRWEKALVIPCRENVQAMFRLIAGAKKTQLEPHMLKEQFAKIQGIDSQQEMQEILPFIDADGNSMIDEDEFFQLAYIAANLPENDLGEIDMRHKKIRFLAADTDCSGTIEFKELARVIAGVLLRETQQQFTLQELLYKSSQLQYVIELIALRKGINDHMSFSAFNYFWNELLGGGAQELDKQLNSNTLHLRLVGPKVASAVETPTKVVPDTVE